MNSVEHTDAPDFLGISYFIFSGGTPPRTRGARARGIVAEPPNPKLRSSEGEGDGADSPTRASA
jgi:hypothetical protein